ncbi:hypothetical protein, partial [Plasmodium yoelii yoelii]
IMLCCRISIDIYESIFYNYLLYIGNMFN